MRVLLIAGEYPPMEGGVGDYTRCLGEALAALGAEVHVLTSARAAHVVRSSPVYVHAMMQSWGWGALFPAVRKLVRQFAPDVVNIQYQAASYGLHPAINLLPVWLHRWAHTGVRRRAHIGVRPHKATPCVTTFHDLLVPYLFPKAGPLRWWTVRALARGSRAVIVTNAQDEQRLTADGRIRRRDLPRLVRIPIGSNVPRALPIDYDRDAWRRRWGLDNDVTPAQAGIQDPAPTRAAFVLCYFGFLNASKGGEELIAALDAVCHAGLDARLLFVGGAFGASDRTNRAYWESVQQSIAARGLTERVVATGFLRPSEVSASLCCADVCVLPYRDGASFRRGSLLAALEHGLTIVSTTPQVALPELRDGENILLVPPHDAPALATAILRLAGDAALRQRLGVGARELSREFGWEQIAGRTLEVFHAVIES